jgi:hypothetical protein
MRNLARWAGWTVQALVLGYLLFFAILRLYAASSGAAVFQYQGF